MITRKQAKIQNMEKYYTGKPCKYGHTVERYTKNGVCVECMRLKTASRKDMLREYSKQYYQDNKEEILVKKPRLKKTYKVIGIIN